ncbi:dihydrodipicolinate synthase family protein [Pseudotabrizicola sp.]|nr:dihydrodipicolinate synthase family protein [Pseudotabrizicola sp.]MDO8884319.1 dihydrodipicolinate synthase family protein [Pseudotabrizicola sp.]
MRHTVSPADLGLSIMAVPPLARTADGQFDDSANGAVIRHLEAGGVTTLLYGGNALAQHWPMSVYADWLDRLEALAAPESWVLPSVGPDAGKLVDQAAILKSRRFPVALMLPMGAPLTHAGMADAMRRFTAESGVQLLVYIKTDNYIPAQTLAALVAEGVVFGVKYAVPRDLGAPDPYLSDIINAIGTERIISGFGEPPAIPHMLDFGLPGFTAGCVCIAPALSNALFQALKQGDKARAEQLLLPIQPLEALRGQVN